MDDAIEAFEEIESNYEHHSERARELAVSHFDAKKVVNRVLEVVSL
jgi:hypothetical protein